MGGERKGHVPLRSCTVCGKKGEKKNFIRIGVNRAKKSLSLSGEEKVTGRGVYVCKTSWCMIELKKLMEKGKFKRVKGFLLRDIESFKGEIETLISSMLLKEGAVDGEDQDQGTCKRT